MLGLGTLFNVSGILLGAVFGLARFKPLRVSTESYLRILLAAFTVWFGLRLTWLSLGGSFWQVSKQLLIVLVSLSLGRLTGRLLRLQKMSNRLGQGARERLAAASDGGGAPAAGFKTCAALFCAAPLGFLGALQDGWSSYPYPLVSKGVMDGLAAFGFVSLFGWGVLLSVVPVLALQGSLTVLAARVLGPFLVAHGLLNSVNAVGGLLVFCVALIMLGLKRLELTDYLPSLAMAPLLTWLW